MPFTAQEIAEATAHTNISYDTLRSKPFLAHQSMDPERLRALTATTPRPTKRRIKSATAASEATPLAEPQLSTVSMEVPSLDRYNQFKAGKPLAQVSS